MARLQKKKSTGRAAASKAKPSNKSGKKIVKKAAKRKPAQKTTEEEKQFVVLEEPHDIDEKNARKEKRANRPPPQQFTIKEDLEIYKFAQSFPAVEEVRKELNILAAQLHAKNKNALSHRLSRIKALDQADVERLENLVKVG